VAADQQLLFKALLLDLEALVEEQAAALHILMVMLQLQTLVVAVAEAAAEVQLQVERAVLVLL
jgi:hypothetical protein